MPTPALELRLFGRFLLRSGEHASVVSLPHKAEELLSYLTLARPQAHSRDEVANALWVDATGDVRKQLRQTLWILRSAIQPYVDIDEIITVDRGWIECRRSACVHVDFWDLQRLVASETAARDLAGSRVDFESALEVDRLCSRPLLEGWINPWLAEQREWVREHQLKALEALVRGYQQARDHARVLIKTSQALSLNPMAEFFHRERIRAYLELGDRVGAARSYQRCVEILRTELGIAPAQETIELGRRVLGSESDKEGSA